MGSNDKALSRRRFLRFAAAGLGAASVAGVLAACGAAAPAADGTAAEAPKAPEEGNKVVVELDFWYWDGSGQLWADAYNKLNRAPRLISSIRLLLTRTTSCSPRSLQALAHPTLQPSKSAALVVSLPRVVWLTSSHHHSTVASTKPTW